MYQNETYPHRPPIVTRRPSVVPHRPSVIPHRPLNILGRQSYPIIHQLILCLAIAVLIFIIIRAVDHLTCIAIIALFSATSATCRKARYAVFPTGTSSCITWVLR